MSQYRLLPKMENSTDVEAQPNPQYSQVRYFWGVGERPMTDVQGYRVREHSADVAALPNPNQSQACHTRGAEERPVTDMSGYRVIPKLENSAAALPNLNQSQTCFVRNAGQSPFLLVPKVENSNDVETLPNPQQSQTCFMRGVGERPIGHTPGYRVIPKLKNSSLQNPNQSQACYISSAGGSSSLLVPKIENCDDVNTLPNPNQSQASYRRGAGERHMTGTPGYRVVPNIENTAAALPNPNQSYGRYIRGATESPSLLVPKVENSDNAEMLPNPQQSQASYMRGADERSGHNVIPKMGSSADALPNPHAQAWYFRGAGERPIADTPRYGLLPKMVPPANVGMLPNPQHPQAWFFRGAGDRPMTDMSGYHLLPRTENSADVAALTNPPHFQPCYSGVAGQRPMADMSGYTLLPRMENSAHVEGSPNPQHPQTWYLMGPGERAAANTLTGKGSRKKKPAAAFKKSPKKSSRSLKPKCIVQSCENFADGKPTNPDILLHRFPIIADQIKKWLLQMRQDFGDIDAFVQRIQSNKRGTFRVCSSHFTSDCYFMNGLTKCLKADAVPSIFGNWGCATDSETDTEENILPPPSKRCQEHNYAENSHTYGLNTSSLYHNTDASMEVVIKTENAYTDPYFWSRNAKTQTDPSISKTSPYVGMVDASVSTDPVDLPPLDGAKEEPAEEFYEDFFSEPSDLDESEERLRKKDPDFIPNSDLSCSETSDIEEPSETDYVKEKKFIIFESCLDQLLRHLLCPFNGVCNSPIIEMHKVIDGTSLTVFGECHVGHKVRLWQSQPTVARLPLGNVLMTAAVTSSDLTYSKVAKMFKIAGVPFMCDATFIRHQKKLLEPEPAVDIQDACAIKEEYYDEDLFPFLEWLNNALMMTKKEEEEIPVTMNQEPNVTAGEDQSEFEEVAVYFTKEEWESLDDEQKYLYKDVMMENYQSIRSLGGANVKPSVISKIEGGEEPYLAMQKKKAAQKEEAAKKEEATKKEEAAQKEEAAKKEEATKKEEAAQKEKGKEKVTQNKKVTQTEKVTPNAEIHEESPLFIGLDGSVSIDDLKIQDAPLSPKSEMMEDSNSIKSDESAKPKRQNKRTRKRGRPRKNKVNKPRAGEGETKKTKEMPKRSTRRTKVEDVAVDTENKETATENTKRDKKESNIPVYVYNSEQGESFDESLYSSHGTLKSLFNCSECDKCFISKSELIMHLETHDELLVCSDCGKSFNHKSQYVAHKKVHANLKRYVCPDCGRAFKVKAQMLRHQGTHNDEKPFVCMDCGRSFKRKATLAQHQMLHTGEKPYSCAECGKSFRQKFQLVLHEKVHTGDKPFACTECGKRFRQKLHLARHETVHMIKGT